jgi:hypothetical protein
VIATITGYNDPGAAQNNYIFPDPENITGKVYYRINMRNPDGEANYSRTLQLSNDTETFSFVSVINPFASVLFFDLASARDGVAKAELIDQFGNPVKRGSFEVRSGVNQLTFDNTNVLTPGIYILRVELGGATIYKRVMKENR